MVDQEKYYQALSAGKMDEVKALTQKALDAGDSPDKILKEGLIKAMDRIGVLFKNNEIYIPEVLIAARAMHAGLGVLKPILAKSNISFIKCKRPSLLRSIRFNEFSRSVPWLFFRLDFMSKYVKKFRNIYLFFLTSPA